MCQPWGWSEHTHLVHKIIMATDKCKCDPKPYLQFTCSYFSWLLTYVFRHSIPLFCYLRWKCIFYMWFVSELVKYTSACSNCLNMLIRVHEYVKARHSWYCVNDVIIVFRNIQCMLCISIELNSRHVSMWRLDIRQLIDRFVCCGLF